MDLSVITVTWNSASFITEQLRSVILGCNTISFEQLIVDNASNDATVNCIKECSKEVRIIKKDSTIGFGAANNLAAAEAKGEFLLFLNPDMRVLPGTLDTLVYWLREHPEVGIASCKLITANGNIEPRGTPRRFPGVLDQLAIILKLPHLFPSVLNHYLYHGFDWEREQEVDSVRGSFLIMRRELYQRLGRAFDPRFFFWFEDVDTCREAKRLGWKVVYTPIISCVDQIGQSFAQRNLLWKQWQHLKSVVKYFWKWRGASTI